MAAACQPSDEILQRYAQVLVRFAAHAGEGVRPGDVVLLSVNEEAKPLYLALVDEVLRAGATYISNYKPNGVARRRYELASIEQLSAPHTPYYRGLTAVMDHEIAVFSSTDLHELEGVDPAKLVAADKAMGPYNTIWRRKEAKGLFTWTVAMYGTDALAAEAGMSLADYWAQIIKACWLDDPDPVARHREAEREIVRVKAALNGLQIDTVHVEAEGVDLHIRIGAERQWLSGQGANIPSFEIFTSPDWRGTEGTVAFTEPLYRHGSLIEGIRLRFRAGVVVEASATRGEELLQAILATDKGAKRLGEFSLTDGRMSRIDRFMAEVLFDENRGGPEGNFHIALGDSYKDAWTGEQAAMRKSDNLRLGFNDSDIHADIVSTAARTVTATLADGSRRVIYADGQFRV